MAKFTEELRVLVVDDDLALSAMLSEKMELEGVLHMCVSNSTEAMNAALKFKPNMILLDIHMPVMSGQEVREELINDPRTRDIPVTFITAEESTDKLLHKVRTHVVSVYHKPIRVSDLLNDIRIRHWVTVGKHNAQKIEKTVGFMLDKYSELENQDNATG